MRKVKVLFIFVLLASIVFIPEYDFSTFNGDRITESTIVAAENDSVVPLGNLIPYTVIGFCCYMLVFHPSYGSLLAALLDDKRIFENYIIRPIGIVILAVLYMELLAITLFI